jgi:hypothetical protein
MPPIPPARGGNATPVPVPPHVTPKRRKPKPRVSLPPPPGRTAAAPPSASPYPQYPFPRIYNPAVVASRAQSAAQDAINQQLAAGMSTLPTVQQQSAPYQQQIASEQGLGQSLLDALKGAQTYRVDLATGVPQAFSAEAAATGGDQSTAARAAATLASYGTSAANQIAQQEATAPAATASNTRIIQQRLQDLLSGPQGHDALARQLSSQIEQNRPALEQSYLNSYTQQAQVPFQEALQLATANTNYDLAQQTYGLNATNAQNTQTYRQQQIELQRQTNAQNLALRKLGLKLQGQRATDSYNLAIARLRQQATNSQNTQDAAAARQAQAALTGARTSIISQANTLYKRTQGTSGSGGTFQVHYFTPSGTGTSATLTPHTESFTSADAMNQRYQQLLSQSTQGFVRNITRLTEPGAGGTQGQSLGYLQNQAVNYGVNLILQSAPWIPRAAAVRMAQQLVNPIFGARTGQTTTTPTDHNHPNG